MSEEPTEYKIDPEISEINMAVQTSYPELWDKLEQIEEDPVWNAEKIIRTRYYQEVSEMALAIITSGVTPSSPEVVVATAIEITDLLIQTVEKKQNNE